MTESYKTNRENFKKVTGVTLPALEKLEVCLGVKQYEESIFFPRGVVWYWPDGRLQQQNNNIHRKGIPRSRKRLQNPVIGRP